jgi:hypothetical protein
MPPCRSLALRATLTLVLLAPAGRAGAAEDPRELKAKRACAAGRVDEGVDVLAELFAETGDLTYVYNQGRCYQQNGVADKAINRFREYLRRATGLSAADRQEVQQFIDELEKQRREQAPPRRDDESAEGRAARLRTIAIATAAVGAAALAAGVILTFKVRSAESDLERDLAKAETFDPKLLGNRMRDGARLETFQWVAYGAAAAAAAGAATCYVLGMRGGTERSVALGVAPPAGRRGLSAWLTVRY